MKPNQKNQETGMMSILHSRWIVLMFILFFTACSEDKQETDQLSQTKKRISGSDIAALDSGKQQLQNGDIVLRTGNDVISGMFAQLNKQDKTFSHCGIAFKENDQWVVYHSIGGEDNPDAKLRREPFEKFAGKDHNLGYGICRYALTNHQCQKLQETVGDFYAKQIPFDMKFNLQSDDRLYCAEMVYKAFNKALDTSNFFQTTVHQGFEYVSTDNLFVNNKARILCHIVY